MPRSESMLCWHLSTSSRKYALAGDSTTRGHTLGQLGSQLRVPCTNRVGLAGRVGTV